MARSKDHDYVYKVVLIGDPGVGKTSMLSRILRKDFKREYEPTMAVDFQSKNIFVDDKIIRGQFWDLSGEERFRALIGAYIREAAGVMIVYDITRKVTFENVERWLRELRDIMAQNIVVMLVGNKADLRHSQAISTDEAKAFSEKEDIFFMETTALETSNVYKAFIEVFTHIYQKALGPFSPKPPRQRDPQLERIAMLRAPVQLTSPPPPPPQPDHRKQSRKRDREDAMIDRIDWICEQQVRMMTHQGLHLTRPLPPSIRNTDSSIEDNNSD